MVKSHYKITAGRLAGAKWLASPNFNARPPGCDVRLLVIHNISLPPGEFATGCVEQFFQNKLAADKDPFFAGIADLQVSAHLFIARCGAVTQFVNFADRAWHAGVSVFEGVEQCNDFSIGIELEGTDDLAYTDPQYQVLAAVTRAIMQVYPVVPERIVGHSEIAPGRKTDPGPAFDWQRYFREISR